MLGAISVN